MILLATLAVLGVALLHFFFLVLEMFLWDTPYGRRVFRLSPELSAATRKLGQNQGLYNGFLAAGLVWGVCLGAAGLPVKVFFLTCVIVAGVFGAVTVTRRALWIQAAPAAIALALLLLG